MLKRILMLDDNQDVLDIVKEALLYEHFEVKVTSEGENIIEAAMLYQPDLIMLDYKLTGLRGDDICREIKAHSYLSSTPVIICSAYINKDEFLQCGCDAIITKPFGLDDLLQTVNELLVDQKPQLN